MAGLTTDKVMMMLHPGIIMIAFGFIIMLMPRSFRKPLSLIAPLAATWAFLQMNEDSSLPYELAPFIKMEFIHMDSLAWTFMLVFCIIAILNSIYGVKVQHRYECGMSLVYAGSVMGVILAGDCISIS